VQVCVRKELANKLERLQSDIHYCYECFEWVVGEHWNGHCQEHLSAITSKRCGSITYCHTLVHPGYSPFLLGNTSLPASERLKSWPRDRKLWEHLDEQISKIEHWPSPCPYLHPLCDVSLRDVAEMQYHFIDDHGMCRTRLNVAVQRDNGDVHSQEPRAGTGSDTTTLGHKRKRPDEAAQLEWTDTLTSQENPYAAKSQSRLTKSFQGVSPTVCPKLLASPPDLILGQGLQPPFSVAVFDSTLSSDCTDFEFAAAATSLKSETNIQREWQPTSSDHFDGSSTDTYVDSDTIFSEFLRSRSTSVSVLGTQDRNAEPTVSLSTNTSAPISPTAPCAPAFMDNDPNWLREERQVKPDRRRIQLRIKPPKALKITLRLACPKRAARATGSRKRA
jgi:hypothetical protein